MIIINGIKHEGNCVSIKNNIITIDNGNSINMSSIESKEIHIHGNILGSVDGTSITVHGDVSGDVDGTSINITGSVNGDVDGTSVSIKNR